MNFSNGPVVISRPDRLGDVIISTSCLEPLRAHFPGRSLYFVAQETWRPILENHPLLHGFIPVSEHLAEILKQTRPAAIVHLEPDAGCAKAAAEAGIPVRIGHCQRASDPLLTHHVKDRRAEGKRHEGTCNFDLLKLLGVTMPPRLQTLIAWRSADEQSLRQKLPWKPELTRFAVINPTAHSAHKRWPQERFQAVAEELRKSHGLTIVWTGSGPQEKSSPLRSSDLDLHGQTNVGELAWLLKHAQILISNDTGTAHLAAAVDCPTVVIFGRTEAEFGPTRWRPLSSRAVIVASTARRRFYETNRVFWRRSFHEIFAAQVLSAADDCLSIPEPACL